MKILLCHSDAKMPARVGIDLWRIIRPFEELSKHVDWQIDHQDYAINSELIDRHHQVKTDVLAKEAERLGQYDIIWTSYFPDPVLFDVMLFIYNKYGTKFVLDIDDDMFAIPKDNPIYRDKKGKEHVAALQYMVKSAPFLVTSSRPLQVTCQYVRDNPTYLWPNYIGGYKHKLFDNKDKVVISFFGSVSHQRDLEVTGFITALRQIMDKHPNVHFGSVGLEVKKLDRKRYTYHPGKPGQAWLDEVWPNINADIVVAPLEDTIFNRAKTNIKWLESSLIPAAFVGSYIPPYVGSVTHDQTGLLVKPGVGYWYTALERLVKFPAFRERIAKAAQEEVLKDWTIENKWEDLKVLVEQIHSASAKL